MTAGPDDPVEIQPGMVVPLPDDAAALAALERLSTIDLGVAAPTVTALGSLTRAVAFVAGVQGNAYPRPFLSTRVLLLTGSHSGGVVAGPTPEPRTALPLQHLAVTTGAGIVTLEWQPASAAIELEDAITDEQMDAAMRAGWAEADRAADEGIELIVLAAGGAGAATAAAAVVAAITGAEPPALLSRVVTPSGRYDDNAWMARCVAVRDALHRVRHRDGGPRTILTALGGTDIAAATGLLLGAATRRTPVMIDGPVGAAAALLANDLALGVRRWILLPDTGGHPAVRLAAEALELRPWLDLRLDLGEGAGSLAALPMLQTALTLAGVGAPAEALPPTRYDTSGNQVFVGVAKPVEPAIAGEDLPAVPPFGPPDVEDAAIFTASTLETAPVGAADATSAAKAAAPTAPATAATAAGGAKVPAARKESSAAPTPVKGTPARAASKDTAAKDTAGKAPTVRDSDTASRVKDAETETPAKEKDVAVKGAAGRDAPAKVSVVGSADGRPGTPTTSPSPRSTAAKAGDKPPTSDKSVADKPTGETPAAGGPSAREDPAKPAPAKREAAAPVAPPAKATTTDATSRDATPKDSAESKAAGDVAPKDTTPATGESAAKQIPERVTAAPPKETPAKQGAAKETPGKSASGRESGTKATAATTGAAKDDPKAIKVTEPGGPSAAAKPAAAANAAQPPDQTKALPAQQRAASHPAESKRPPAGAGGSPATGKPAPDKAPATAEASSAKSAQTPAQRSAGSTPASDPPPTAPTPAPSGTGKSGTTSSGASASRGANSGTTSSGASNSGASNSSGAKPSSTTTGGGTSTAAESGATKSGSTASGAGTSPLRPRKQT